MACTTILVGKKASYNGSTMIARNDDGNFDVKKLTIIQENKNPKKYKNVNSHLTIELPEKSYRYTITPNVDKQFGIWGANGINSKNVAMTATETTTTNVLVLGADPYVKYEKANRKHKEIIGGIGEEDFVVLVLPYINSAKEGVIRLGELLEKYGTYESNGIAFSDKDEIWWFETIGGHNWMAKRIKDEEYAIMPNQFGLDSFDLVDAYGKKKEHLCSSSLKALINDNHLDCNNNGIFNPRLVFGSHNDSDHVYNTPRAWFMARYFNSNSYKWDGENADYKPESDNIPFSLVPDRKITVEDVKYILSSYFQGTVYNPYQLKDIKEKGKYRSIGVNRTGVMAVLEIRNNIKEEISAIEWVCFGPNNFNALLPVYANVDKMPKYLADVNLEVSTETFYWTSRLIASLTDPYFDSAIQLIERYQLSMASKGHELLNKYDSLMLKTKDYSLMLKANEEICSNAKEIANSTLKQVLQNASVHMKNAYNRKDN